MKIFESVKKGLEEEYENPETLCALEPIMHIHSCTVESYPENGMKEKYEYSAKKLIDRITRNKTIIMLR
ncbi:hypothetical protein Ana3638_14870 [Anaerocolumna sedimenticola]|uniref:Uncharacterized protein n=1 Tax=Anaerocolumna sedimenticola TaxID=2696063 RepID=A0A6P1TQ43_9FIRM|nr:hypothetical protein [Anaerocolumna sedimenticola]QHQ61906.1 hypothetical protein Ana3638_14870 [Anaerocolumna sedimenticola]